jgi:hypothetical protein
MSDLDDKVREFMESEPLGCDYTEYEFDGKPYPAFNTYCSPLGSNIYAADAKLFYKAQQRAVLEGRIDELRRHAAGGREEWDVAKKVGMLSQVEKERMDELEQQLKELEEENVS